MLSFLFSRRFDAPVAIVASYRSDDLHRRHPLRTAAAEWSRLPGVSRVELGRLPDDDVRALVGSLHPGPMSERALRGIVERAEGNAFFTEELVRRDRGGAGRDPRGAGRPAARAPRPARRRRPARGPGRRRCPAAGCPTCCSTGSSTARSAPSTWRCGRPSSATSWCRWAATATRSGTPCWPRPSTTTCCRASGCGCTRPTPRPSSRAGWAVRRPSWPGTPARPTTSRPRPAPASPPVTRRWPWPARTRPPGTTSSRSSWPPTPTSTASTWSS